MIWIRATRLMVITGMGLVLMGGAAACTSAPTASQPAPTSAGTGVTSGGEDSPAVAEDTSSQQQSGVDETTCKTLADEAVRVSDDGSDDVKLLKVRGLKVVKDVRSTFKLPTGTKSLLIYSCKGTGVWSDGDEQTKVYVMLKVDADGEYFVGYRPTQ